MSNTFNIVWAEAIKTDAVLAERIGDRIGSNRTDLANRAYALAADLREWAQEVQDRVID